MTFNNENAAPAVEEHASDIKTAKTFAELTTEDLKGMDNAEVEQYAKGQGWQNADRFKGDPSKVKTARQFIEDGKNELPIIRANNKKLADSNDQLRREMANNTKTMMAKMEKQDARHKQELERGIKESEAKIAKATADFDIVTATQETENKIVMQNELKDIDKDKESNLAQAQKSKEDEWNDFIQSEEANDMMKADPRGFVIFRQEALNIYSANNSLSVKEVINNAKANVYPKAQPANIQSANSSKSKTTAPSISKEDRDWINSNIANETQMMRNRGSSDKEIAEYTKTKTKHYEEKAKEQNDEQY